jgi:hypothetical protein
MIYSIPVTLLLSASTDPSWMHKIMAFGFDMNVWDIWRMFSRVSAAMSVVTVCGKKEEKTNHLLLK